MDIVGQCYQTLLLLHIIRMLWLELEDNDFLRAEKVKKSSHIWHFGLGRGARGYLLISTSVSMGSLLNQSQSQKRANVCLYSEAISPSAGINTTYSRP